MQTKLYIKITCTILLGILFYEHFGRMYNVTYRPSYFLKSIADHSVMYFIYIGKYVAYLSSFFEQIDFKELKVTIEILSKEFFIMIMMPPISFIWGYVDVAKTLIYPEFIVVGSMVILCAPYFIREYIRYKCKNKLIN
jgi:hypothetical protein